MIPSGEQHELTAGDATAIVVEVGGGLRTYRVGDWDVLDGYPIDAMASGGRGQPLLPWPNRIRDGKYRFGGRDLQLPLTEVAAGNASHGLTRWSSWELIERDGDRSVTLGHRINPQPGYPFGVELALRYAVAADGLTVELTATNLGDEPCPFGAGFHPYISLGVPTDELVLQVPAATRLPADERGIPIGREPVAGTAYDFTSPARIGDRVIDSCFTDLTSDEVVVSAPNGRAVTVWMSQSFRYVMVYTADKLPPGERRRSVAIEPMTCPPNAFASGEAVRTLQPGKAFTASWGIRPTPAGGS